MGSISIPGPLDYFVYDAIDVPSMPPDIIEDSVSVIQGAIQANTTQQKSIQEAAHSQDEASQDDAEGSGCLGWYGSDCIIKNIEYFY